MVVAANQSPSIPTFDLGISDDEDTPLLIVEDSLDKEEDGEPDTGDGEENISCLIVEDSLDKDGESDTGEEISNINIEVRTKVTEVSNEIEDGASFGKFKQDFDLNKAPDEDVHSVSDCGDVEEAVNRAVFDLNELPDEGLDSGLGSEAEETRKGIDDMLKIYIDSIS